MDQNDSDISNVQIFDILRNNKLTFERFLHRTSGWHRANTGGKCCHVVCLINPFYWLILPGIQRSAKQKDQVCFLTRSGRIFEKNEHSHLAPKSIFWRERLF